MKIPTIVWTGSITSALRRDGPHRHSPEAAMDRTTPRGTDVMEPVDADVAGFLSTRDSRFAFLRTPVYIGVVLQAGRLQVTTTRMGAVFIP